jgi:large subunit ribosomal protein L35
MPKHKTRKSVKKRVRVTKTGKVMCTGMGRRHLNSHMTRDSVRNHGKKRAMAKGDALRALRLLGKARP